MSDEKLAIDDGTPVRTEEFPPWPYFEQDSIDAAMEPLKTGQVNYWTGEVGMKFEKAYAQWCGREWGISTSSGTTALHTALGGMGIGPGDEVIVPSYTFIASSMCVAQAGAIPVFADVEKLTHTISPQSIEEKISPRTKAIIPVHLYGCMCDMDPIMDIAERYDLWVLEDFAQAPGGEYKGKKAGSIGHIGAVSFCQSKHFTTGGEGGMVVTDDEDWAWECRSFRDHGYDVSERMRLLELEAALPYIHNRIGFNFRMTEMQSAIGLVQLEKMDSWHLPMRRRNAKILDEQLKDEEYVLQLPIDTEERKNAYWLYPIILDTDRLSVEARRFFEAVAAEGVPAGPVQWPQGYKEKCYSRHRGFGTLRYPFRDPNARQEAVDYIHALCPNAAWAEERTFFVPVHPTYEEEDMRDIAAAIKKVGRAYLR
ncbi:MAG: DegT/DnrJ/EryC1/StrS family aminotransferase [Armatimonadota bacterium]|nr:DegT/DnrJ/EryC1/StrS family aminotransferase [Armatimonadota bacterium]